MSTFTQLNHNLDHNLAPFPAKHAQKKQDAIQALRQLWRKAKNPQHDGVDTSNGKTSVELIREMRGV